jgi:hypothetical protein
MNGKPYKPGQSVRASVVAAVIGVLTDATAITLTVLLPDGSTQTPSVVHDSQGTYHADFLIPIDLVMPAKTALGFYRWVATGTAPPDGYGVVEVVFQIAALDF